MCYPAMSRSILPLQSIVSFLLFTHKVVYKHDCTLGHQSLDVCNISDTYKLPWVFEILSGCVLVFTNI